MSRTTRTERNPNHGKFRLPEGYTDIGYEGFTKHPMLAECHQKKHRREEFDNSLYKYRCSDVIRICHECKIVTHVDMTD